MFRVILFQILQFKTYFICIAPLIVFFILLFPYIFVIAYCLILFMDFFYFFILSFILCMKGAIQIKYLTKNNPQQYAKIRICIQF